MNEDYKPDFKILSLDQCIWVTGSTNKETEQNEKPEYCPVACAGYNKACDYYMPMEDLEVIVLTKRYK